MCITFINLCKDVDEMDIILKNEKNIDLLTWVLNLNDSDKRFLIGKELKLLY